MPRKSKVAKDASTKTSSIDQAEIDPQPTLTAEKAEPNKAAPKDRDTGGKFTRGNSGGPGNPHARSCARMLEIFRNAISEEEMFRLVRKMFEKAEAGDMSAAKMIFSYKIGKPLPAPHPDSIDRNEWDHYQKDAMHEKEMALVMNGLPSAVGNDIARVSLPIMTAARKNELGMRLMDGMELNSQETGAGESAAQTEESEQVEPTAEEQHAESQPIANGNSSDQFQRPTAKKSTGSNGKKSDRSRRRTAKLGAGSNGKMNRQCHPGCTNPTSAADTRTAEKKTPGKTKKRKAAWLEPLAKQLQDSAC